MSESKDVRFDIHLFNATGGAAVGTPSRIAVTITDDYDFLWLIDQMMIAISLDVDVIKVKRAAWCQQIKDAMLVKGGDIKDATNFDYFAHFFSFFWKVLFAFIPPASFLGGWLCFVVSVIFLGFMTAIIIDLSHIFGCLVGLEDFLTAMTVVTIGTSVSDLVACDIALKASDFADDAIGYINGSNAGLVFLGLGLPWSIAAIYNIYMGRELEVKVQKGVEFSCFLFAVLSFFTLGLLLLRRKLKCFGKAELGGPTVPRYFSAVCLVLFWIFYIILSHIRVKGYFTSIAGIQV